MADGPNVRGMVNDPDFQGMSPADKRAALGKLTGDKSFADLSDGETMQFISKFAQPQQVPQAAPLKVPSNLNIAPPAQPSFGGKLGQLLVQGPASFLANE